MKTLFWPALLALTTLVACQKPDENDPLDNLPPQQELPNPIGSDALVTRMGYDDRNQQTITYNAAGQPATYRSQWQYDESDPAKLRIIDYTFHYDQQNRPVRTDMTGGWKTTYDYNNRNLVSRMVEQFPGGALFRDNAFVYDENGRVREIRVELGSPGEGGAKFLRYLLEYDNKGNLTALDQYREETLFNGQIRRIFEIGYRYGDFDNKVNPSSWLIVAPYVPQAVWQYNNPGYFDVVVEGYEPNRTLYRYTYNSNGLPQTRTSYYANGYTQTLSYTY